MDTSPEVVSCRHKEVGQMSDELQGVLIGGLLAIVGGLLGALITYWLGTLREKR